MALIREVIRSFNTIDNGAATATHVTAKSPPPASAKDSSFGGGTYFEAASQQQLHRQLIQRSTSTAAVSILQHQQLASAATICSPTAATTTACCEQKPTHCPRAARGCNRQQRLLLSSNCNISDALPATTKALFIIDNYNVFSFQRLHLEPQRHIDSTTSHRQQQQHMCCSSIV